MKQPVRSASYEVNGYVSDVEARVRGDAVIYHVTLLDLGGKEHMVRMRMPASWMRLGQPLTGRVVRMTGDKEYRLLQDARPHPTLSKARVLEAQEIRVEKTPTAVGKGIIHAKVGAGVTSIPVVADSVLEKASALSGGQGYVYVADTPAGSMVVAVQSVKDYQRDERLGEFLSWLSEDESQDRGT